MDFANVNPDYIIDTPFGNLELECSPLGWLVRFNKIVDDDDDSSTKLDALFYESFGFYINQLLHIFGGNLSFTIEPTEIDYCFVLLPERLNTEELFINLRNSINSQPPIEEVCTFCRESFIFNREFPWRCFESVVFMCDDCDANQAD